MAAATVRIRRLQSFRRFVLTSKTLFRNDLNAPPVSRCFLSTKRSFHGSVLQGGVVGVCSRLPGPISSRSAGCTSSLRLRQGFSYCRLQSIRKLYKAVPAVSIDVCRYYSSDADREILDPLISTQNHLSFLHEKIKKELATSVGSLQEVSHYYFDGQGKFIRPLIVYLMASACNQHMGRHRELSPSQQTVVMISEMIHTASLIHDDVIDGADTRRSKRSVNKTFGDKACVLAGDYVLSCASQALAKLGNTQVVELLAEVVDDLIRGEFMQLGSKEDPDERFEHYLKKTYKKTASLIACCCKGVAVFGRCTPDIQEMAFQYGKNIGIAFQLVDDALDFVASDQEMGKPTAADLSLGLATAPVLFACEEFPEVNALVMRRFKEPGDVEKARKAVQRSQGITRTFTLAEQYTKEAVRQISRLSPSREHEALVQLTEKLLRRRK